MKKIISLLMVTLVLCGSTFCSLNVKAADVDTNIDTIVVDVSIPSEDTGKTIDEVLGINIQSRATSMPSSVWDWSNGTYRANFSIDYECCYTSYKFTGYSTLYVDVRASRNIYTPAADVYKVYVMSGIGQGKIETSVELNTTDTVNLEISQLDPSKQYAFAIVKANDTSTLSGTIWVKQQR